MNPLKNLMSVGLVLVGGAAAFAQVKVELVNPTHRPWTLLVREED